MSFSCVHVSAKQPVNFASGADFACVHVAGITSVHF